LHEYVRGGGIRAADHVREEFVNPWGTQRLAERRKRTTYVSVMENGGAQAGKDGWGK
jgi:hypothetical protein